MIVGESTPAYPQFQPTLADVIQGSCLLGDPDWIVQRKKQHAETQPDSLGARGDGGCYGEGSGQDAERREMVFGQPNRVHPHALRLVHHGKALGKRLLIGVAVRRGELKEKSELHGASGFWPNRSFI